LNKLNSLNILKKEGGDLFKNYRIKLGLRFEFVVLVIIFFELSTLLSAALVFPPDEYAGGGPS